MSRIDTIHLCKPLLRSKPQGRKALIPFVTAGYPYADVTPELMHAMVAGGADVIELGVPFSDPSADGPVIQKAGDKALAFGIGSGSGAGHGAGIPQDQQHYPRGADGLRQPGGTLRPETRPSPASAVLSSRTRLKRRAWMVC